MKKAIIHIGAHKTGSSSLQYFLYNCSDYLNTQYEIYYPKEICDPYNYAFWGHNYLAWYFVPPAKLENFIHFEDLKQLINNFLSKLSEEPPKILLLSSEDFTLLKKAGKTTEFINLLSKLGYEDIYIIMYVRRQDKAAISLYQTSIKNINLAGISENFISWYNRTKWIYDYYSILKDYQACGCKIIAKVYERSVLKGQNIVDDFVDVLSYIYGSLITIPTDYFSIPVLNVSLPSYVTMLLRQFNMIEGSEKIKKTLLKVSKLILKYIPDAPKYDIVPPSIFKRILNDFRESNIKLFEEFIGEDPEQFLKVDSEEVKDDNRWKQKYGYPGALWVELLNSLISIINNLEKEIETLKKLKKEEMENYEKD